MMDYSTDIAIGYGSYFNGILFMTFELYLWQVILLAVMMAGAFLWMINEIRGYKASLASWSSLIDAMLQDDLEEIREAFVSYMRWKKQQSERSRWLPRAILDYFGSGSEDLDRRRRVESGGIGGDASGVRNSGTQTDLEAPSLENSSDMEVERKMHAESETESEKRVRYRYLSMDEASNPDLWMEIHHHDNMDIDRGGEVPSSMEESGAGSAQASSEVPGNQLHVEPNFEDMQRARNLAIHIYERRRQEAIDRNDLNALDELERYTMCDRQAM